MILVDIEKKIQAKNKTDDIVNIESQQKMWLKIKIIYL